MIPKPPQVNVLHYLCISKHKEHSNGFFKRHKARLVGDGAT